MVLLLPSVVSSGVLVADLERATVEVAVDFFRCNPCATRFVDDILRPAMRGLVTLLAPSTDGGDEALDVTYGSGEAVDEGRPLPQSLVGLA